jgi:hypothetical protein
MRQNLVDLDELACVTDAREEPELIASGVEYRHNVHLSAFSQTDTVRRWISLSHRNQAFPTRFRDRGAPGGKPRSDLRVPLAGTLQLDRVEYFHSFTICEIVDGIKCFHKRSIKSNYVRLRLLDDQDFIWPYLAVHRFLKCQGRGTFTIGSGTGVVTRIKHLAPQLDLNG